VRLFSPPDMASRRWKGFPAGRALMVIPAERGSSGLSNISSPSPRDSSRKISLKLLLISVKLVMKASFFIWSYLSSFSMIASLSAARVFLLWERVSCLIWTWSYSRMASIFTGSISLIACSKARIFSATISELGGSWLESTPQLSI